MPVGQGTSPFVPNQANYVQPLVRTSCSASCPQSMTSAVDGHGLGVIAIDGDRKSRSRRRRSRRRRRMVKEDNDRSRGRLTLLKTCICPKRSNNDFLRSPIIPTPDQYLFTASENAWHPPTQVRTPVRTSSLKGASSMFKDQSNESHEPRSFCPS